MEKSTLRLLEYLEKIFPQDIVTDSATLASINSDIEIINALERNKLIEKIPRATAGVSSAISYRITSLGIQFLDQTRQKRTNNLLLALTIIITIFSLLQLVLTILKI